MKKGHLHETAVALTMRQTPPAQTPPPLQRHEVASEIWHTGQGGKKTGFDTEEADAILGDFCGG